MQIKLSNGKSIDLAKFDALNGKTSKNNFVLFLEKNNITGDGNSVFSNDEIANLKNFISSIAGSDGVITLDELETIRTQYSSIFANYSANDMMQDLCELTSKENTSNPTHKVGLGETVDSIISDLGYTGEDAKLYKKALVSQLKQDGSFMNNKQWLKADSTIRLLNEQQLAELGIVKKSPKNNVKKSNDNSGSKSNASSDKSPLHLVRSGDTLQKIVADLGYKGADAHKYIVELTKQLEADGSFMNDKQWLKAGSTIKLLDDDKIAKLGLSKPQQSDKNNETKPIAKDDHNKGGSNQFNVKYHSKNGRLLSRQKTPIDTSIKPTVPEITVDSISDSIRVAGHVANNTSIDGVSQKTMDYLNKYSNYFNNCTPEIVVDESTGVVHALYDLSSQQIANNPGLKTVKIEISSDCSKMTRIYENGKIVDDYEYKDANKNKSVLVQAPKVEARTEDRIMEPLPITIDVDMSVSPFNQMDEDEIQDMNEFKDALIREKAYLMQELNIDSDTYNRYAKLAMCIAVQETGFGTSTRSWIDDHGWSSLQDSVARFNRFTGLSIGDSTSASVGMTQIKIRDKYDDPKLRPILEHYNISKTTPTPEDSAVATIAVLANMERNECQLKSVQEGAEAAKGRIYYNYTVKDSNKNLQYRESSDGVKGVSLDRDDILLYIYNGAPVYLKKGTATPAERGYNLTYRKYSQCFKINEDPDLKAKALKNAQKVVVKPYERKIKSMGADLGWGIGQITFEPTLYSSGVSKNTQKEMQEVRSYLSAKSFDPKLVDSFINKIKNGDFAFTNGVSNDELSMLTEDDIRLIIQHSDNLKNQLSGTKSIAKKRALATKMDKDFKYEYLSSHASQYSLNSVRADSVTYLNDMDNKNVKSRPSEGYNTGAQKRCNKYLNQLRGKHKPDGGLYTYENRRNGGMYLGFDVERDKGINYNNTRAVDLLIAQNAADASNILKTSGACLTGAKQALIGSGAVTSEEMSTFQHAFQLADFCAKHSERFEEIKFVQISNSVVREITAADIAKLPAGYIVVYGNKNMKISGHAGITSGNGQIYADEVDNANWDNFVATSKDQNGKGEHGYVRIFRVKDSYYDINNDKKILVRA